MSRQEDGKKTMVCVTGASGYIASWIVKLLLHRGYTVKATIRDLNDSKKTEHLLALDGAKERLHLFQADLLEDGSFDAVVEGCDGVFHTASPILLRIDNPQSWYPLSKILAEEVAWKFTKEKAIDMVAINPAMVIGPLLQPTPNASAWTIFGLINASTYRNITVGIVHVEDVVKAHILAFETPSARGRYCMAESVVHFSKLVQLLKKLYPSLQLPDKCADDAPIIKYLISKEKARSLGITFTPLEETIKETIESFKDKKFL